MGQDELVLRVTGGPSSPHSPAPGDTSSTAASASANGGPPASKTRLTHSRESSGASVKV